MKIKLGKIKLSFSNDIVHRHTKNVVGIKLIRQLSVDVAIDLI